MILIKFLGIFYWSSFLKLKTDHPFLCLASLLARGAQPLAQRPNMAHGAIASSLHSSPCVGIFGGGEQWQYQHPLLRAKFPSLAWSDWGWAMPPFPVADLGLGPILLLPHRWIRNGPCSLSTMCLERDQAVLCPGVTGAS